jgi:hypothetical protein
VFLRQGKTEVSFVRAATKQTIDYDTMALIHEFHAHIFEDILRVAKNAVAFSPENAHIPLLVVPLIKSGFYYFNWLLGNKEMLPDFPTTIPF